MHIRTPRLFLALLVGLGITACSKSPTGPSGSTTISTAVPVSPANGATIANDAQPVTLTISNATASASAVYTFEVATDGAFVAKVLTQDVPEGSGQTSLKLDVLPSDRTYYWRVRATAGDTVGAFSTPVTFSIGPAVTIQPPVPVMPVSGGTTATPRPTLAVQNSTHSGPVGSLVYRFEIATDAGFSGIVQSGTVAEAPMQTSFNPPTTLAANTQYYWHARATDTANNVSSAFSEAWTFTTPAGDDASGRRDSIVRSE